MGIGSRPLKNTKAHGCSNPSHSDTVFAYQCIHLPIDFVSIFIKKHKCYTNAVVLLVSKDKKKFCAYFKILSIHSWLICWHAAQTVFLFFHHLASAYPEKAPELPADPTWGSGRQDNHRAGWIMFRYLGGNESGPFKIKSNQPCLQVSEWMICKMCLTTTTWLGQQEDSFIHSFLHLTNIY